MLKFEKVSEAQFVKDWSKKFDQLSSNAEELYNAIQLPKRSTKGSAGYDFFAPESFRLEPGKRVVIPTGIRAAMPYGVVLMLFPRSGQGVKFKLQLMNTVGVIDADYYEADNEGHIMIALYNDHPEDAVLEVEKGQAFAQGVFLPYYLTDDDSSNDSRHGGFGSTDKK